MFYYLQAPAVISRQQLLRAVFLADILILPVSFKEIEHLSSSDLRSFHILKVTYACLTNTIKSGIVLQLSIVKKRGKTCPCI